MILVPILVIAALAAIGVFLTERVDRPLRRAERAARLAAATR